MPLALRACIIALCYLAIAGCADLGCCATVRRDTADATHFFVFGFGRISVPHPDKADAIVSTQMQSFGLSVSDQPGLKFNLGYASSTTIAVMDGAEDVRVEFSDGGYRCTVLSAERALLAPILSASQTAPSQIVPPQATPPKETSIQP